MRSLPQNVRRARIVHLGGGGGADGARQLGGLFASEQGGAVGMPVEAEAEADMVASLVAAPASLRT